MKPRCLDLFCGAGGAGMGLHQAGFEVVGVDIAAQKNYPFEFHQADAMTYPLGGFDFIWASPPCQKFCSLNSMPNARKDHFDLLTPTRPRLQATEIPYCIENVPGAPLARGSICLCGTSFALGTDDGRAELRRHRWFELSQMILAPECQHNRMTISNYGDGNGRDYRRNPANSKLVCSVFGRDAKGQERMNLRRPKTVGVYGSAGGTSTRDQLQQFSTAERSQAMGIDWMTGNELSQAISKYIGEQMMPHVLARMKSRAFSATDRDRG